MVLELWYYYPMFITVIPIFFGSSLFTRPSQLLDKKKLFFTFVCDHLSPGIPHIFYNELFGRLSQKKKMQGIKTTNNNKKRKYDREEKKEISFFFFVLSLFLVDKKKHLSP